jgi:hypothetical protein
LEEERLFIEMAMLSREGLTAFIDAYIMCWEEGRQVIEAFAALGC